MTITEDYVIELKLEIQRLEAKCALLAASLKKADAELAKLRAALSEKP